MGIETVGSPSAGTAPVEQVVIGTDLFVVAEDLVIVINEAGSGRYFTMPTEHLTAEGTVSGAPSWLSKANVSSPVVINEPGTYMVEIWPQNTLTSATCDEARFSIVAGPINMPAAGILIPCRVGLFEQGLNASIGPFVVREADGNVAVALFFEAVDGIGHLGTGEMTPWVVITKLA